MEEITETVMIVSKIERTIIVLLDKSSKNGLNGFNVEMAIIVLLIREV